MRTFAPSFTAALSAARDGAISPVWFLWVRARDRETGAAAEIGLWSGDEDVAFAVELPTGGTASRTYLGGCNLVIDGLQTVADLTDNPLTASISQIAPAAQQLVRGYDARLAYAEVHATTWAGGVLASVPQLMWVGIVDEGPIATPSAGEDGQIALTIRSEIMTQLTAVNPAKSSDAHQRRRQAGDRFSEFSGAIQTRKIKWYQGK